jgi:hypothetical protein
MVEEGKSVDFGFVTLHPCPYRSNWKQIMLSLFPRLGPALLHKSAEERDSVMVSSGAYAFMFRSKLLAIQVGHLVQWGIEVEPKRSWWRATFRREEYLFKSKGAVEYAKYIASSIKTRMYYKMLRCYISFLRQVALPVGTIRKIGASGHGRLWPYVPVGRVRPVALSHVPSDWVVARDPEKVDPNPCIAVADPDEELQKVLHIQPEAPDVRTGGPVDMAEPGDPA